MTKAKPIKGYYFEYYFGSFTLQDGERPLFLKDGGGYYGSVSKEQAEQLAAMLRAAIESMKGKDK
jgi:hypothetical protein